MQDNVITILKKIVNYDKQWEKDQVNTLRVSPILSNVERKMDYTGLFPILDVNSSVR